jgi:hypothetical protein
VKFYKEYPVHTDNYEVAPWRKKFEASMLAQTIEEARRRGYRVLEERDYVSRWVPRGGKMVYVVEVEVTYGGITRPRC